MRVSIVLTTVALLISACGSPSSLTLSPQWTKNLHSTWNDQTKQFDISRMGGMNPPQFTDFVYQDGAVCHTDLAITGQNSVGIMAITTSVYLGGGAGDPGCVTLIDNYTYQNPTGFALEICNLAAVCSTYQ